ncbi:hypothetical protein C8A05DRAFT_20618 [Staphylotrichum tortipilum]|uniref:CCHC-type domain-containing protein n=1 Tax=Staphylotrichum tortipilum TaxID=2831512 RepID=A0AAN6MAA3_9PEZI|nr:hypothetical protein C8A05DRAFT_20618 [Staphylotrichum longicolle]
MTRADLIGLLEARDEYVATLHEEITTLRDNISDLRDGVATLNGVIADQATKIRDLERRQDQPTPRPPREPSEDHSRTGREDSILTQNTSATTTGMRSGKVPDPPIFYNEKERDTIRFEQWYRAVKNKLLVNADHFSNDQARQTYMETRLGGTAVLELAPYLEETHPEPVTTSARLLEHLWEQYHDPMRAQKAVEAYENLQMKPGDDFMAFKNDFVRLAGECAKSRTTWKHEFHRRLTHSLQRTLMSVYVDRAITFDQYVHIGLQHDALNKRASEHQAAARKDAAALARNNTRPARRNAGNPAGNPAAPAADAMPGDTNPGRKKHTPADFDRLIAEGRCFRCKEKGHTSRDCPRKATDGYDARIRAMRARWVEEDDSTTVEPAKATRVRFEDDSETKN